MDNCNSEQLASAIVERAVSDYRELKTKDVEEIKPFYRGTYSKKEIEVFFHSDWCETILRGIGSRADGVTILRYLKHES